MIEIKHVILDELGLHARSASQLVRAASKFKCAIMVGDPDKMVDAKSILGIMLLVKKQGDELTLTFDGEDETEAAQALETFLKKSI